jgi:cellulose synthase operon protein C
MQRVALQAAHGFDPSQPEPLRGLFELARESKDEDAALAILRRLAPLEQHDRKVWRMLLERLVAKKEYADAVRAGESAIFVDVESADTHSTYAEALSKTGDHTKALFELESALACHPKPKQVASVRVAMAREYMALGKKADARKQRDEALAADAENADAKALSLD